MTTSTYKRIFIIVMDSVGIGEAPDAEKFGDKGADTFGHIAERMNGILKTELISRYYNTIDEASVHIARCITIYNHRRRHSSLNWQIPADVHNQKGPQTRRWKNYYYSAKLKEVSMQQT